MIEREKLVRIATACRLGLISLVGKNGSIFCMFPKAACGPAHAAGAGRPWRVGSSGPWPGNDCAERIGPIGQLLAGPLP